MTTTDGSTSLSSVQHVDGEGGPTGDGDARSRELPHEQLREKSRRARHAYLIQDRNHKLQTTAHNLNTRINRFGLPTGQLVQYSPLQA